MRLGERLLQNGQLTAEQLEQALRTQTAVSGRLGTNLIELGFVYADAVSLALAEQKGVPAARRKHFDGADPELRKLVPRHLAERLGAIPLATATRFGRELVVAFLDPDDREAVDEVTRYAGLTVRPSVAAEFYIIEYLDKLYGVPPRRMLRTGSAGRSQPTEVYDGPSGRVQVPRGEAELDLEESAPRAATGKGKQRRARPVTAELDAGWDDLDDEPPAAPAASANPAMGTPARPADGSAVADGAVADGAAADSAIDAAGETSPNGAPSIAPSEPPIAAPRDGNGDAGDLSPGQAFDAIARATNREQVGDALLGYLRRFSVGLVLVCRQELALGWRGHAPGADPAALEGLSMPLSVPSMFEIAYRQGNLYLGPPPDAGATIQDRLWKVLHCAPPSQVIVCPVTIGQRIVNLLYAHADDQLPVSAGPDLTSLAAAAGETYVRLIKQRKN